VTTKAKVAIAVSTAAVVLFCGFIFYMSAQPADDSDVMSLGIVYRIISFIVPGYADMSYADQVYWQSSLNHIVRKAAHFSEFALLGMLVANLLYRIAHARQVCQWGRFSVTHCIPSLSSRTVPTDTLDTAESASENADAAVDACPSVTPKADASTSMFGSRDATSNARTTAQHPRILTLGLAAWLLTSAYAATDEIHQLFVPGRAGMVADVILDSCGALTGVVLFCAVLAIVRAIRKKHNKLA